MKKEVAEKWAAALRSGKYKQTQAQLKRNDGFCCLGVLCDISGLGHFSETCGFYIIDGRGYYGRLPEKVRLFAGMKTAGGVLPSSATPYRSLVDANDSGKTFTEIAEIINQHWEVL